MRFFARLERLRPVLAMLAVNIALGTMNSLVKMAMDEGIGCLAILTLRQLVATLFMIPIAFCNERGQTPEFSVGMFSQFFMCALLGATMTQYLSYVGMRETSATFACAFFNVTPVFTFIIALVLRMEVLDLRRRAGIAKVVGTIVCVGGAMVLTFYKGAVLTKGRDIKSVAAVSHAVDGRKWIVGSVAMIGASLAWCSWFFLQSKVNKRYPAIYRCTAIIFFISFLQSFVLNVAIEGVGSLLEVRGMLPIFTVLFSGIVGSGIGFLLMLWCISKRGPVFPAAFTPVIQIVVAIIGLTFMHERLHLGTVLGSILVILGLYSLLWGKNMEIPSDGEIEAKQLEAIQGSEGDKQPV